MQHKRHAHAKLNCKAARRSGRQQCQLSNELRGKRKRPVRGAAASPGPTRIRVGPTPQGRCCAFSWSIPARVTQHPRLATAGRDGSAVVLR
jgi:hypothetical protein